MSDITELDNMPEPPPMDLAAFEFIENSSMREMALQTLGSRYVAEVPPVETALHLAGLGWAVFPCREKDGEPYTDKKGAVKIPERKAPYYDNKILRNGKDDATTDPAIIRQWWARWPGALIGVYCEASGFIAVDIDTKHGIDGLASWQRMIDTLGNGVINCGPIQTTPTGGQHWLFKNPQKIKVPNNAGKLAPGLDLRSNGYICTGEGYQWLAEHGPESAITDAPGWLLAEIEKMTAKPAAKQTAKTAQTTNEPTDPGGYWLRHYLAQAQVGNRNDTGWLLACQLRDSRLSKSEAETIMKSFAGWAPGNGYTESEALASLESAYSGVPREPATLPGTRAPKASQAQAGSEPTEGSPQADDPYFVAACLGRGETGDSELFSALFAARVKFDRLEREFYTWQGTHWALDKAGSVIGLVQNRLAAVYLRAGAAIRETAKEQATVELAEKYHKRGKELLSRTRINNVLALVESQPGIRLTGDEWDIDPLTLPVKNGLIDLQAGTFRPTTPADYVRTFAPVEWRGINEPAPIWEKTLLEIFGGDSELVNFARRLFGYSITGTTKEQVLPILYGDGANGKSTILEVLAAVLGADFGGPTSADSLMDMRKGDGNAASPYVFAMRGKRLVWANESKEGQKLNTGLVKQLTGDSLITARPLFGMPVTFQQTHKIMLITNHLPRIPDSDDYAIWRRVLRIPFDVRFVVKPTLGNERKINKDLPELLKAEYSGILAWLVRGCLEWQAEGLAAPAAVVNATEKYREDEDLIGQFIDERAIIGAGFEAMASDIYKAYTGWAEKYGYNPMSAKALSARLKRKFGEPNRKTTGMFYQGIGLLA